MRFWIQYHNYNKLGYLPGLVYTEEKDLTVLDTSDYPLACITTRQRVVKRSIGDIGFFIVGYGGSPRKYVLWSWCLIDTIDENEDGGFDAWGDIGQVLNPPPALRGRAFENFKRRNANFSLGFRDISKDPFLRHILALAADRSTLFAWIGFFSNALFGSDTGELVTDSGRPSRLLREGKVVQVFVNAYERDPRARLMCLHHYGYQCVLCGFDFVRAYGPAAAGIINVHHLVPLSEIGREYDVDPIRDMRPVCPNCHAVIHARRPPYSMRQVKAFLRKARAKRKRNR